MLRLISLAFVLTLLTGCAQMLKSTPLSSAPGPIDRIQLIDALPQHLPKDSHALPGRQYVLLPQDKAATLLVPLPFVGEAIVSGLADAAARGAAEAYKDIDPYQVAVAATQSNPLFQTGDSNVKLYPFVFVNEGHDARYRLSLVFQVETGAWMGRYFYHLPTTIAQASLRNPSPDTVQAIQRDLGQGARILAALVQQDRDGSLRPSSRKAKIGSLYIVGGNVAGLVSPEFLHYPGADVLKDSGDTLVLRHDGDPSGPGQAGALLFGVHYFHRDQLFFFEPQ